MSRLFSIFKIFLSVVFFYLTLIQPAFAASEDWVVTMIPDPVPENVGRITITVTRKDGKDFFTQPNYTTVAWTNKLDSDNRCRIISRRAISGISGDYFLSDLTMTKTTATTTWDFSDWTWANFPKDCKKPDQVWHFRLFVGDNDTAMMNTATSVIADYPFTIIQAGGLNPVRIEAKNGGKVFAGEKPVVLIYNAVPGSDYTFWWHTAQFQVAGYYQRDKNPTNPLEVIIPTFTTDEESRKLCMEYGNFGLMPPGSNDCNPNVTFYFYPNQLPPPKPLPGPPGACKIKILAAHRPVLAKYDSATAAIESLPPDEESHIDLVKDTDKREFPKKNADSYGSMLVPLFGKPLWGLGEYTVNAYDKNNQLACTEKFTVNEDGSAINVKTCAKDDPKCIFGGGDPCTTDPTRGPALKTAIGCIHTNPPEFAKDLLTFLVGIGGGLAFLMMLFGAFQMMTSAGNPDTLRAGRERLTSAVIGLLFIIFSILFLKIIGVDILKIPGFV